ncbi:LysE/ArgO family amino acid transporter [Vibrio neptunius]|uniref:LysE/ArgO family amino acid transporter n=1 Tax=Vibrio neptunius TaxID=170651 RepID=UPI0039EB32F6
MSTFFAGFTLGLSLILAIGAQNAFVLKQGIKQHHVLLVCLICSLSDAILISAGVAGFGLIVAKFPLIELVARYGGGLFLLWYGLRSPKMETLPSITLQAFGQKFFKRYPPHWKPDTVKKNESAFRLQIVPYLADREVESLVRKEVPI